MASGGALFTLTAPHYIIIELSNSIPCKTDQKIKNRTHFFRISSQSATSFKSYSRLKLKITYLAKV